MRILLHHFSRFF